MTFSKIFFYLCLSFVGGILLGSLFSLSQPVRLIFLISGFLLITLSLSREDKKLAVFGFCLIFALVGVLRFQIAESKMVDNRLQEYNDQGQVSLIGIVSGEPDVRGGSVKLELEINGLRGEKVLVTANRYPEYSYGDELRIKGELKTPSVFEDFNYKDYLAKEGIYSVIYWAKIEKITDDQGGLIFGRILSFKERLRSSIYQNLSPPQSSILGAIVLGDKRRMSDELKEKLNIAGVRHITAISGMHITILSVVLMQFLIGIGFWRGQAFYLTIIFLISFIIMVGLPSSAVRAGIMVGFFLLAQKLGRKSSSSRVVVFAATGILIVNPLLLRFDVGFQLSFLAVMGIIYLGPAFQSWLRMVLEKDFINLRSIISMTLAAQIFTLPILIYNFGIISLVAPLANILILPLLPSVIGLGFLFGLTGIVFPFLGQVLSWPCWLLLTYIVKVVDWFSGLSFSSLAFENVHWIWLAAFYLVLALLIWRLREGQKLKFLDY